MSVFKDSQQFYDTVGELLQRAARDPNIGPRVARAETVIQLRYTDPEAQITINARGVPTQFGAYVDVFLGPCDLQPEVVMSMTGDLAHEFWLGRVNLASALARRQIRGDWPGHQGVAAGARGRAAVSAVSRFVESKRTGRFDLEVGDFAMTEQRVVLVDGVAGYWGGRVAERLLAEPDLHVIGLDTEPPQQGSGIDFIQADMRNPLLVELLKEEKVHTYVHLAFIESDRPSETAFDFNVMGTMKVLSACAEAGVKRVILQSSTLLYGAQPGNSAFLREDHPLNAKRNFGTLRDLLEIENFCRGFPQPVAGSQIDGAALCAHPGSDGGYAARRASCATTQRRCCSASIRSFR